MAAKDSKVSMGRRMMTVHPCGGRQFDSVGVADGLCVGDGVGEIFSVGVEVGAAVTVATSSRLGANPPSASAAAMPPSESRNNKNTINKPISNRRELSMVTALADGFRSRPQRIRAT